MLARRAGHGPRLAPADNKIKRAAGPCRGRAPRRAVPLAPRLRRDPRQRGRAGGGHPEIWVAALLHCSHTGCMTTILNVSRRRSRDAAGQAAQALGIKGDDQIIAEATPEGLLLRPAVTLPIEMYSDKRTANSTKPRQSSKRSCAEGRKQEPPADRPGMRTSWTPTCSFLPPSPMAPSDGSLVCSSTPDTSVWAIGDVVEEARRNLVAKAPAEAPMLNTMLARMQVAAAQPHPAALERDIRGPGTGLPRPSRGHPVEVRSTGYR